jgi:hypothetical protein
MRSEKQDHGLLLALVVAAIVVAGALIAKDCHPQQLAYYAGSHGYSLTVCECEAGSDGCPTTHPIYGRLVPTAPMVNPFAGNLAAASVARYGLDITSVHCYGSLVGERMAGTACTGTLAKACPKLGIVCGQQDCLDAEYVSNLWDGLLVPLAQGAVTPPAGGCPANQACQPFPPPPCCPFGQSCQQPPVQPQGRCAQALAALGCLDDGTTPLPVILLPAPGAAYYRPSALSTGRLLTAVGGERWAGVAPEHP